MARTRAIALALMAALPAAAGAQPQPAPAPAATATRASHGCFRGAPIDRCSWFMLTESGIHYRISSPDASDKVMVVYALGFMKNRSPRTAIGAELFASADDLPRAGAALRWRHWLSRTNSLDVTAGVHFTGVPTGSPTVQVKLTAADLIGFSARYDYLRTDPSCPPPYCSSGNSRLYLGAELGAEAGVIGWAVSAVLVVVYMAAYYN